MKVGTGDEEREDVEGVRDNSKGGEGVRGGEGGREEIGKGTSSSSRYVVSYVLSTE